MIAHTFFNDFFETPTYSNGRTYSPSKFAVEIKDDAALIGLSVIGFNAEDIDISCFEDKIEVKAKKNEEAVNDNFNPFNQLTSDIDETIRIGKAFDGRKSTAEIKNGILLITIDRKEESKPKKLTLKVG